MKGGKPSVSGCQPEAVASTGARLAPRLLPRSLDPRALAFAAYGKAGEQACFRYRGFAADPVEAIQAARRAEALIVSRIGAVTGPRAQVEVHFDTELSSPPPTLAIGRGEDDWPYEADWLGAPLPVLPHLAATGISRSKQTEARGLIGIGARLRADAEIKDRQRLGQTLRYGQSVGWWPSADIPRLNVRFGVWADGDPSPVVLSDDTALAVLATLLKVASMRSREARVSTLLPRKLRSAA
jgi:hypothetical protein